MKGKSQKNRLKWNRSPFKHKPQWRDQRQRRGCGRCRRHCQGQCCLGSCTSGGRQCFPSECRTRWPSRTLSFLRMWANFCDAWKRLCKGKKAPRCWKTDWNTNYLPPIRAWVPFLRQNPFKKTRTLWGSVWTSDRPIKYLVLVSEEEKVDERHKCNGDCNHSGLDVDVRGLFSRVLVPVQALTQTYSASNCVCRVVLPMVKLIFRCFSIPTARNA